MIISAIFTFIVFGLELFGYIDEGGYLIGFMGMELTIIFGLLGTTSYLDIKEVLKDNTNVLETNTKILENNNKILQNHTKILEDHSKNQNKMINNQNMMVNNQDRMIDLLGEIRDSLRKR
jgi:hypothetical protein